ncbi:AI-2E family transporter [bacterium]|nr:AI-2E family transporter [bacterium]
MNRETVNRVVLLALLVFISVMFFRMIEAMLMALLMAAILAGLLAPVQRRMVRLFGGRAGPAAVVTELLLVLLILVPLAGLAGLVTAQAIKVGNTAGPWIRENLTRPDELSRRLEALPFYERIEPYRDDILTKVGEVAGSVSNWLVGALQDATVGTVTFFFMFFVMLYSLYFFLTNGRAVLEKILWYLPLEDRDEQRMLDKFLSVTRATLKSTGVIGLTQGALGAAAFAVAGIPSWVFWGAVMVVLSAIPGLGAGIVMVPAAIWLLMDGHWGMAIGMLAYLVLVVGMVDNFLRPRIVGQDTQMPELLVFLSTIGGLSLFGVLGFIIGPIVGALFVTIWEIYGEAFKDLLPEVGAVLGRRRGDDGEA